MNHASRALGISLMANPSGDDYQAFINWPQLLNHIIGNDGVRTYDVRRNGAIVERNYGRSSRASSNHLPRYSP